MCIVEGHGEVEAVPNLCARVRDMLNVQGWFIDPQPVRQPRASLVDQSTHSPNRPPNNVKLRSAITLALRRPADAVLVLCDSDDDCAAFWGPRASDTVRSMAVGGAVMVIREYEAWLLACMRPGRERQGFDQVRDAKRALREFHPDYRPTTHQLRLTQGLDLPSLWARSDSFDKFVRTLAGIFGAERVGRPTA